MSANAEEILRLGKNPVFRLVGIILSVLGLLMLSIVLRFYLVNNMDINHFLDTKYVQDWLPYFIPGLCGLLFLIIGLIFLRSTIIKSRRIKNLLENGSAQKAEIISNTQNFGYRVNGIPQRIVTFQSWTGEQYKFKFFNEEFAYKLKVGSSIKIRHDNKGNAVPDINFLN